MIRKMGKMMSDLLVPLMIIFSLMLITCGDTINLTAKQQQGKRIYESLCDSCHNLINPKTHTDTEWVQAINRYGIKLQLQPSEKDAIAAYLTFANDN